MKKILSSILLSLLFISCNNSDFKGYDPLLCKYYISPDNIGENQTIKYNVTESNGDDLVFQGRLIRGEVKSGDTLAIELPNCQIINIEFKTNINNNNYSCSLGNIIIDKDLKQNVNTTVYLCKEME